MPETLSRVAAIPVIPAWWGHGTKVDADYLARHPDWSYMDDTPHNGDTHDMTAHQWRICHASPFEVAYRCDVAIGTIQNMGFDQTDAERIGVVEEWLRPDPLSRLRKSPPLCFLRDAGYMELIDGYHRLYVAIHVFGMPQIPILVGGHRDRVQMWG